jgi:sec-independent protein translocase protein TatC
MLFQLFLILILINRIKPLQPKKLFKYEKYVIAGAFIVSFLMVPAPNIMNQIVLAVPIIAMYQLAILIIAITNRGKNNKIMVAETSVLSETRREPMKPVLISDIIRA